MGFLSSLAPLAGAAIGAFYGGPTGAMAGGQAGGAISSAFGASEANAATAGMTGDQMRFQEHMSNSAHQREVTDLKLAGLNPILAAGGAGASSPTGSSATMQNEAPDFSHAISTAMEGRMADQNLKILKHTEKKTELEAEKALADQALAKTQSAQAGKLMLAREGRLDSSNPENRQYILQAMSEKNEWNARSTEARRSQIDNEYGIDNAAILNNLDTAQKGANVLSTGASVIKPWTSTTGQIKDNRNSHYHVNKQTGEIKND